MKRIIFFMALTALAALWTVGKQASQAQEQATVREVVEKSTALLQTLGTPFIEQTGCISCHNNTLPALAVAFARTRGIKVNEAAMAEERRQTLAVLEPFRDRLLLNEPIPGESESASYILLSLAANRQTSNRTTDALTNYLLSRQERSGQWKMFTQSRPPLESSDFNVTALSLRVLQLYAPEGRQAEVNQRVAKARQWLLKTEARTNEDRVFQLLGLHWSAAPPAATRKLVEPLLVAQRADGGWAQLPGMESDAYATGQALVALSRAGGLPVSDAAYQRGVEYLRRTWHADGSWHVRTRSFPIQKQFASGFPYERDQWISAAATSWAVMALSLTLEPPTRAPGAAANGLF